MNIFQSTLSMRRATHGYPVSEYGNKFQSTLSMRRATALPTCWGSPVTKFQSTLSMRRATCRAILSFSVVQEISIHALHEESDHGRHAIPYRQPISIHALHEESDISSK